MKPGDKVLVPMTVGRMYSAGAVEVRLAHDVEAGALVTQTRFVVPHPGIDPALIGELVAAVRECDAKLTEMLEWFDGSDVPAEAMWVQNRLHSLAASMEADATKEADDPTVAVAGFGGSRYSEIPLSDREGPDPESFADVED